MSLLLFFLVIIPVELGYYGIHKVCVGLSSVACKCSVCSRCTCKMQVYALKAKDFEDLLGDLHDAFLEHAKLMYSQKTVKSMTGEDKHTQLVSFMENEYMKGWQPNKIV